MKIPRCALAFLAVLLVGAALLVGGYLYKFGKETGQMNAVDTKELTTGIYAVKDSGFVNMYLIQNGDAFIAVDAGKSLKNIKKQMGILGIPTEKVTAVLLTHTDSDHIGGIGLFTNARVYISSAEEQMINGKTPRMAGIMKNSLQGPYTLLKDGDVVGLDSLTVKSIHTPGHTPGSMSYIIDNRFLFTGDTLSIKGKDVKLFNTFFNMNSDIQGESIRKLAAINGIEYMFTAHYGYTDDFDGVMAPWR